MNDFYQFISSGIVIVKLINLFNQLSQQGEWNHGEIKIYDANIEYA